MSQRTLAVTQALKAFQWKFQRDISLKSGSSAFFPTQYNPDPRE
jgi:hypothetical protein